jgi:riboflavin kinase/FMN adenylyltransferase
LLDFHPIDVTAQTEVEISFLRFQRPEIKFPSVDALRQQIGKDVRRAQRYFGLLKVAQARRGDAEETWPSK